MNILVAIRRWGVSVFFFKPISVNVHFGKWGFESFSSTNQPIKMWILRWWWCISPKKKKKQSKTKTRLTTERALTHEALSRARSTIEITIRASAKSVSWPVNLRFWVEVGKSVRSTSFGFNGTEAYCVGNHLTPLRTLIRTRAGGH